VRLRRVTRITPTISVMSSERVMMWISAKASAPTMPRAMIAMTIHSLVCRTPMPPRNCETKRPISMPDPAVRDVARQLHEGVGDQRDADEGEDEGERRRAPEDPRGPDSEQRRGADGSDEPHGERRRVRELELAAQALRRRALLRGGYRHRASLVLRMGLFSLPTVP
jgi:hypothetical protein